MATVIYGASDDLIELSGDVHDEIDVCAGVKLPYCRLGLSDGTLLSCRFGVGDRPEWKFELLLQGNLFIRIDPSANTNENYSDRVYFRDGLKWAVCQEHPGNIKEWSE